MWQNNELALFGLLGAYMIGNLSLSYIWVKFKNNQDLRQVASGSLGARNAGRVLGKTGFIVTLLFDALKGGLAVLAMMYLTNERLMINLAAVLVICGHIWPVVFGFKGGKGISCSLGAFLLIHPMILGVLAVLFIPFYAISRNVVKSGLLGFLFLPPTLVLLQFDFTIYLPVMICNVVILWAHRANIRSEFNVLKGINNE